MIKYIDLFAGIGGIRLGFSDENTKCVFSCEIDKFARKTYYDNFGDECFGDINDLDVSTIPDYDVLLAGFPCQPFSIAGKRKGLSDEKSGDMFFKVAKILRKTKPKAFLLENVRGLLNIENGKVFETMLDILDGIGYSVNFQLLDAKDFGLAQQRKRVIIVGFLKNVFGNVAHGDIFSFDKEYDKVDICDILEQNVQGYGISKYLQESYLFRADDGYPKLVDYTTKGHVGTLISSYWKVQRKTGTFVADGDTGVRFFSELECKRLQGFPESFVFEVSRTQMFRQLGNSVPVPMIRAVSNNLKKILRKEMLNV